jgi:ABC-type methionine transport system ATPase subunit
MIDGLPPLSAIFYRWIIFLHVEFILQLQGVNARTRQARSSQLLQAVGLEGMEDRSPSQLSGGQQQRVAVARALASHPAIVLADEPPPIWIRKIPMNCSP